MLRFVCLAIQLSTGHKVSYMEVLGLSRLLDPRPAPAEDSPSHLISTYAWYERQILVQQHPRFKRFSDMLGQPDEVQRMEPHKTEWDPLQAMDLNQSSVNDTIVALGNILQQTGITDAIADEFVTFVHGDLGGSERILSAQLFRSREETSTERLSSIVDVPGLFHAVMASEDAVFRLHVLPQDARFELEPGQSHIFKYIRQLLPNGSDWPSVSAIVWAGGSGRIGCALESIASSGGRVVALRSGRYRGSGGSL